MLRANIRDYIYDLIIISFGCHICSKLMGFSLMAARSGVYIRVIYSTDTPIPWFEPFHELKINLSSLFTLGRYNYGVIPNFIYKYMQHQAWWFQKYTKIWIFIRLCLGSCGLITSTFEVFVYWRKIGPW